MALNQEPTSIPALVLHQAGLHPAATILRKKQRGLWRSVAWSELLSRVQSAALALRAIGFRSGDVAAVLAETRPEWVTADLAILSTGGVCLGIPADSSEDHVAAMLRRSGCRVLFVENEEQLDKALSARPQCPALRSIVIFDMVGLRDFADPACEDFTGFLARGGRQEDAERAAWQSGIAAISPRQPAVLLASTDAVASLRSLTHGELLARLDDARARMTAGTQDERLALMPLSDPVERVFGLYHALATGVISNFLENPDTVAENLQEVQPTLLGADAATWHRLHDRTTSAAAAATPVQRLLYRLALRAGGHGGMVAWLARLLVLRPVRRELGMARLRLAYVGAALPPEIAAWAAALGIRVTTLDGAPAASSPMDQRYGAMPVEA